jgi:protein TonB
MRLTMLACVLGMAISGPAWAQEPPDDPAGSAPMRPPVLKEPPPRWRFLNVGGYYPERAERMNVQGLALIACQLEAAGRLSNCRALDADPANYGFVEASLRMAKDGWLTSEPRVVDGAPVAKELVRVLVRFEIDRKKN